MAVQFSPWLKTDRGFPLMLLEDHMGFTYTKTLNGAGWFSLAYPVSFDDFKNPGSLQNQIAVDRQVQIWRRTGLLSSGYLDFLGFIRKWTFNTTGDGGTVLTIAGADQNDLLKRRIIAYASGSTQAKTSPDANGNYFADNSMVDIVDENLGSGATDTARDLTGFNFNYGTARGVAAEVQKEFAWRDVQKILSDLSAASKANGSDLFYRINVSGVDSDGAPILNFGAFNDYPGGDKTWKGAGQGSAMIFGLKWGNLSNPVLSYDYSNEINYVYVGGAGEGSDREIVEVEDTDRSGASIWNRREAFVDARQQKTTAQLTSTGEQELERGRALIKFSGTILSTPQTPYGSGWDLGSKVTVEYLGIKFNGIVQNIFVSVLPNGTEEVSSSVEFVEYI